MEIKQLYIFWKDSKWHGTDKYPMFKDKIETYAGTIHIGGDPLGIEKQQKKAKKEALEIINPEKLGDKIKDGYVFFGNYEIQTQTWFKRVIEIL